MKHLFTLAAFVCALFIPTLSAQTSWKGTSSTNWNQASNWTAGVPNSGVDAIIGDANFTGPFQPSLSTGGGGNCRALTVGGTVAATLSIGKNLNCYGNITINSNGSILQNTNNRVITARGNWTNSGTYSATANNTSVIFSGTSQTISGSTTFRAITINTGTTVVLGANTAVTSSVTVNGTLDPSTYTLSGAGGITVNAGATLTVKAATFAANYSVSGSISLSGTSTVHYASSTLNQTVSSAYTYGYLRISGGTTKTVTANLPALNSSSVNSGRVYIDAGTLDLQSFTCNRGTNTAGGSFIIANSATLKIGGTNTFPVNYATVTIAPGSTVNYCGTNQTITDYDYGHLTFQSSSGAAVKTMPATPLIVAGDFTSSVGSGTSVSYTAASALTVNRYVSIGSGTTFNASSHSHIFKNNFTNNGTFTGSTSTVTFTGNNAAISGTGANNFNNIVFTGNGITAAATTTLTIAGNVSTSGPATFTHTAGGTATLSGASKTISGTGLQFHHLNITGSITTAASFWVSGNLNVSNSFIASSPSELTLSGAGMSLTNSGTCTMYALHISGTITTASDFTLLNNLTVVSGGTLTATAGTATFNGTSALAGTANLYNVTINATRTLTLGTNSNLGIANTFSKPGTLNVTASIPNTVTYNGAGAQSIISATYSNLVLANGGTKTPAGNLTINRDITINSGVTLNGSTHTLYVYRHWNNNGTFTAGTSTVQFSGTDVGVLTGATTFYHLIENKNSSTISVELANNMTATNVTITSGNMQTGTNSITITGSRTGTGIIIGTITHAHAFVSGAPYYFESAQNAITFNTPSASLNVVTVKVIIGPVLNMDPWLESVNREYEILVPAGTYTSASFRYHYEDDELNAFVEPTLALYKYNSLVQWDSVGFTSRDANDNYIEYTGLTSLPGRYTASGIRSVVMWNGSVSTAWEDPLNWTTVSGTDMSNRVPAATDAVHIGQGAFTYHPSLNTTQTIGILEMGSVQAASVTLNAGVLNVLGSVKGTWSANASHTINVAAGSLTVGTYLVLSDGTSGHDISLTIGSGSVTVGGDLTQNGAASVSFSGNGTLTLSDSYHYLGGTFNAGSGAVIYNGSEAQHVAHVTYNNLTFSKTSSRAYIDAPLTILGNLTTTTGGELYVDGTLTVGGNVTIGAGSTLIENDVLITVGGNWTSNGLFTVNNGTITFNGTGTQTVNENTFNTFVINKTSGTVLLTGNLILHSDLTLTAGSLDLSTYQANRSNTGGTLTLAAGTTLYAAGANNFPANFVTGTIATTSTVEYNGTIAQTIADVVYGNLVLTNGAAAGKSLFSNTSVNGNMLINAGATFIPGAMALSVNGDFTNYGTYTPGTSTLILTGASRFITGTSTFNHLLVNGTYTVTTGSTSIAGDVVISTGASLNFGSNSVTLDGDLTVNGSLTSNGVSTFTGTRVQTLQIFNAIISASTGVINFNGTVAPVLNSNTSPTFATLNINNTAGVTPSVPWTVYYACNIAAGASFNGGALSHTFYGDFINNGTVTSSGELNFLPSAPFTSGATIKLDGVSFVSTGKVTFGGTAPMTIVNNNPSFDRISITNTSAAGVTPPSSWTMSGELYIGASATFHGGTGLSHTLADNFTNNGTLNGQTSLFTFTGAGVAINGLGTTNFYNLTIPALADLSLNSNIGVAGNLVVDGGFTTIGRNVSFNGTTPSVISGAAGALTLDDMEQNKTGNVTTLSIPVTVTGDLLMTNGIVNTTAVNILTLADNATASSGNAGSYVDGPMKKIGDDAFVFPLGDGAYWARLGISAPANATDAFTAQYFAAAYSNTTTMAANPAPALNNVSTIEYWTCDRTTGTSNVNVTLYWENNVRSAITNYSADLVVARWNGSAWVNAGQSDISPAGNGYVTSSAVTSFSPFTFGSLSGSNPLPIQLLYFTATLNEQKQVDLEWATAIEINNDFFTVERTTDGVNYETIAVVQGAGSSSQQHTYSAVDASPLTGVSFYRLKQTDANGNFSYSPLQTISNDGQTAAGVSVFPNPCDGSSLQVNVPANAEDRIQFSLVNTGGNVCFAEEKTATADGLNTFRLTFPVTLVPGMYFLYVTDRNSGELAADPIKVIVQ